MTHHYRRTTALLASLSLLVPAPALAQGGEDQCPDGSDAPCVEAQDGAADDAAAEGSEAEGEAPAEPEATPAETESAEDGAADDAAAEGREAEDAARAEPEATPAETESAEDGAADAEGEADTAVDDSAGSDAVADDSVEDGSDAEPPIAAAAKGDGAPQGEVTTETVTEETARSSDEEFDTQMSTEEGARAEDGGERGGLSNLEKALVVGAGALAVGAILRGNREVVSTSADRVVVQREDGSYGILKDDNALLRRPGTEVETETFSDGSTRTTVTREDGSRIVTIRGPELQVLRRVRIGPDGTETVLIDDTGAVEAVDVAGLPKPETPSAVALTDVDALREALQRQAQIDRAFSLSQVRDIREVRRLAAAVELDNITFETGSAAIEPSEAEELSALGTLLADIIAEDADEVFLVEGYTDAVGSAAMNLALSDRRAESVALALTEYFDVPPENMVVQGYGESDLRVETEEAERANRRATVRRITPLLRSAAAQ